MQLQSNPNCNFSGAMVRNKGYTIMELMIVAALLAILSSVAFATYTDQVRKARRSTAADDTLSCAAILERRYTLTSSYSDNGSNNATSCDVIKNDDYTIAVTPSDTVTISGVVRHNAFDITTTASSSAMLADLACRRFTYDEQGTKTALKSDLSTLNTETCWRQ